MQPFLNRKSDIYGTDTLILGDCAGDDSGHRELLKANRPEVEWTTRTKNRMMCFGGPAGLGPFSSLAAALACGQNAGPVAASWGAASALASLRPAAHIYGKAHQTPCNGLEVSKVSSSSSPKGLAACTCGSSQPAQNVMDHCEAKGFRACLLPFEPAWRSRPWRSRWTCKYKF